MDASPKMSSYLPQSLVATGLVVGAPVVAVWTLRAGQVVGSTLLAVVIGAVLSIVVSFAGSAYWANSKSSRDVLFSELMIWGWLRRRRAEYKLTAALAGLAERVVPEEAAASGLQLSMLKELAGALEAGDPYTRGHSRRVARYATMIAERMGLAAEDVDRIRTAAAVHDVGKVYTPIEVLHKPGRLTDEEYAIVKAHPVDGARLVEALRDDRITAIVRHHHERLDGRGYPSGLSGTDIPLGARIVAVADTFDAITSARSYRPASPHRKALDILTKEAGTQLDADAVRAFRACYTGRRPFAMWVTLLAFPQRLSTSLGNTTTAGAVSISKAVVAASTVAVVGGAAASAAPLVPRASSPGVVTGAAHSPAAASSPALVATALPATARTASQPGGAPRLGAALTIAAAAREHSAMRRLRLRASGFPRSAPRGGGSGRSGAPTRPAIATRPSVVPASRSTVAGAPTPVSTVAAAPSSTAAAAVPAPVTRPTPVSRPAPVKAAPPRGSGKGKGNTVTKGGNTHGHHGKDGTTTSTKVGGGSGSTKGAGSSGKGAGSSHDPGKGNGNGAAGSTGNGAAGGGGAGNGKGAVNGGGNGAAAGAGNGAANGNGNGIGNVNGAPAGNGNGGGKAAASFNGNGNTDSVTTGTTNGNGAGGGATGAGTAGTGTTNGTGNASGSGDAGAGTTGNGTPATNGNGDGGTTGSGATHHGG